MEDDATLFYDHSTLPGRLTLLLHRLKWKHVILPAVALIGFAVIAALLVSVESDVQKDDPPGPPAKGPGGLQLTPGNSLLGDDDPAMDGTGTGNGNTPGWTVVKKTKPGDYEAEGCENGLYPFEGIDTSSIDPTSMKSLKLRELVIDAATLSNSLKDWTNLESIVIENAWIDGNFSRVYLPNLKKFIYHQFRNGKTDAYKLPESLKQIMFFDQSPSGTWDLNKDVLNLGIEIQLKIEGTKILDIDPPNGEININTHNCEDIYKNFNKSSFPLTTLSLNWCPVTNVTLDKFREDADTLKFLFLNNAVPYSSNDWTDITSTLRNLEELHVFLRFKCDWPGYEIFLNVSNLSPTVETLSVTNLDLSFEPGVPAASVRNLSLDSYVGDNIVNNFDSVFPNVKSVALFNVTQNRTYPLIHKVLQVKPQQLIVTNLTRVPQQDKPGRNGVNMSMSKAKAAKQKGDNSLDIISQVEKTLQQAGIPQNAPCFMLELQENGTYVGRVLSAFQRNFFRYKRLAFSKIDTYADYVTWDADPA